MTLKLNWTMSVAVISTAHHPQGWRPSQRDYFFKTDDEADGVIVYIADLIKGRSDVVANPSSAAPRWGV